MEKNNSMVIDEFLEFLMDFIYDDRLKIYKRIKNSHRYYNIDFEIDEEKTNSYPNHLKFIIDNRNYCIEIISPDENQILYLEDKEMVEKWSNICEEHLNKDFSQKAQNIFESSLINCFRKDIHREYQMRKLNLSSDNDSLIS